MNSKQLKHTLIEFVNTNRGFLRSMDKAVVVAVGTKHIQKCTHMIRRHPAGTSPLLRGPHSTT